MGRGAMLASILFVTLPYKAPVFRVGVPDLAAINAATLAADNAVNAELKMQENAEEIM